MMGRHALAGVRWRRLPLQVEVAALAADATRALAADAGLVGRGQLLRGDRVFVGPEDQGPSPVSVANMLCGAAWALVSSSLARSIGPWCSPMPRPPRVSYVGNRERYMSMWWAAQLSRPPIELNATSAGEIAEAFTTLVQRRALATAKYSVAASLCP